MQFLEMMSLRYLVKPNCNRLSYVKYSNNIRLYCATYNEHLELEDLYVGHVRTNLFQKALLSVGAASVAITNPHRHDMVALLGETTGYKALQQIHNKMLQHPEGQLILREKPRISSKSVDVENLSALKEDTLGYAYYRFLKDNDVSPDTRMPVQFVDDTELAYAMQRYREVHDLIHTVLGMKTNILGEVAVKWVEAIQTRLPMCIVGALFGPLRFRPKQRKSYIQEILPWAVHTGKKAKFLMNVYYENRWEQNIEELRRELLIDTLKYV